MTTLVRSRYFKIPITTARRKLAVARLLLERKPPSASADVDRYADQLAAAIEALTAAYVTRHLEAQRSSPREDAELDALTDSLWGVTRDRLDHWQVFTGSTARRYASGPAPKFDYAAARDRAEEVARARELLLGLGGVEWTRLRYVEQAEHMRTLWQVVEGEKLEEVITEAIGDDFFEALRDVQVRYLAMIERRLAAERGSEVNLRGLAAALEEAIVNYALALLVALDEADPTSVAQTQAALRPLDGLREQLARERGATAVANGEPEADAAVAELLAEEQSLDSVIGGAQGEEAAVDVGDDGGSVEVVAS